MKIKELPFSAIWDLCRYLDNPNLLYHSGWRGLLSKAPGELAEGRVAFVKFTIEPAQHACKIYTHTYTHTHAQHTHVHTHTTHAHTHTHTHTHHAHTHTHTTHTHTCSKAKSTML